MKPLVALSLWLVSVAALSLSACASSPEPPTDAFQAADIAIANAEKEQAAQFAPVEMKSAHEKISAARAEVADDPGRDEVMAARWMAEEARVDAELASAQARLGRAEAVNAELQKNLDTLTQELQRAPGGAM